MKIKTTKPRLTAEMMVMIRNRAYYHLDAIQSDIADIVEYSPDLPDIDELDNDEDIDTALDNRIMMEMRVMAIILDIIRIEQ